MDLTAPHYTCEDYHIYSCPFVISFLGFSQTRWRHNASFFICLDRVLSIRYKITKKVYLSKDFIFPTPTRDPTLLTSTVAVLLATLFSLSIRIFDLTCSVLLPLYDCGFQSVGHASSLPFRRRGSRLFGRIFPWCSPLLQDCWRSSIPDNPIRPAVDRLRCVLTSIVIRRPVWRFDCTHVGGKVETCAGNIEYMP